MRSMVLAAVFALAAFGCGGKSQPAARGTDPVFVPVNHASFIITSPEAVIYVDPVGKPEAYATFAPADIIVITHTHQDHLAPELLARLKGKDTTVIGPQAVIDQLKYGTVMNNGETKTIHGVTIEAVPAYNLAKDRLQFHPKGVGNGYVMTAAGKRIYISGDTEDVPEVRALKGIDYAFVCMNLPYTMTPEQAASLVLEMKPKVVFPYHYRQPNGFSDVARFKLLVAADPKIEVRGLKWYD